jgi:hypothetical protein
MLRVLMIVNYLHTQACLFWRRICTSFVRKPSVESDRPGPLWPVLTVLLDEESGSFGAVLVMKSTEDRDGYNIGRWNRLLGWGVAPRSLPALFERGFLFSRSERVRTGSEASGRRSHTTPGLWRSPGACVRTSSPYPVLRGSGFEVSLGGWTKPGLTQRVHSWQIK